MKNLGFYLVYSEFISQEVLYRYIEVLVSYLK